MITTENTRKFSVFVSVQVLYMHRYKIRYIFRNEWLMRNFVKIFLKRRRKTSMITYYAYTRSSFSSTHHMWPEYGGTHHMWPEYGGISFGACSLSMCQYPVHWNDTAVGIYLNKIQLVKFVSWVVIQQNICLWHIKATFVIEVNIWKVTRNSFENILVHKHSNCYYKHCNESRTQCYVRRN